MWFVSKWLYNLWFTQLHVKWTYHCYLKVVHPSICASMELIQFALNNVYVMLNFPLNVKKWHYETHAWTYDGHCNTVPTGTTMHGEPYKFWYVTLSENLNIFWLAMVWNEAMPWEIAISSQLQWNQKYRIYKLLNLWSMPHPRTQNVHEILR